MAVAAARAWAVVVAARDWAVVVAVRRVAMVNAQHHQCMHLTRTSSALRGRCSVHSRLRTSSQSCWLRSMALLWGKFGGPVDHTSTNAHPDPRYGSRAHQTVVEAGSVVVAATCKAVAALGMAVATLGLVAQAMAGAAAQAMTGAAAQAMAGAAAQETAAKDMEGATGKETRGAAVVAATGLAGMSATWARTLRPQTDSRTATMDTRHLCSSSLRASRYSRLHQHTRVETYPRS